MRRLRQVAHVRPVVGYSYEATYIVSRLAAAVGGIRRLRYYELPMLASTCKFLCVNTTDKVAWASLNKPHRVTFSQQIITFNLI